MDPIVWAILLMVLGLGLVVLEIFIPSGGILGFMSVVSILGSILLSFRSGGAVTGFTFVAVATLGLPTAVILAFKYLPNTPIGRRLLLKVPTSDEVLSDVDPRKKLHKLVGKFGQARSAMLPGGTIKIDNVTYEAVSESGAIDEGETVEVVMVRNNRLVVRRASGNVPSDASPEDVLSQPIDTVGIEPFEEPLG